MAVAIRYEPNHSDFRKIMMGNQTKRLAQEAAILGVAVARAYAAGEKLPAEYIASIRHQAGSPVVLGGNPRQTARVYADYPWIEFGSGLRNTGRNGSTRRPQGGHSPAYRILGRTGARIGKPPAKGIG